MKELLLIEDDKKLSVMYAKKFQNEGFHVTISEGGTDGFQLARGNKIDVIVLDLVLPGLSGIEILQMLRTDKKTVKIPVIVYTNSGDEGSKNRAITYGADEYILKVDSTPEGLCQTINKVLTRMKIEEI
ncbi:MAG: response regulator [Patescibacteria group bacterium]|nr:response regulator [Patescibacteria group bacterium]